jgi:hypothetical protein
MGKRKPKTWWDRYQDKVKWEAAKTAIHALPRVAIALLTFFFLQTNVERIAAVRPYLQPPQKLASAPDPRYSYPRDRTDRDSYAYDGRGDAYSYDTGSAEPKAGDKRSSAPPSGLSGRVVVVQVEPSNDLDSGSYDLSRFGDDYSYDGAFPLPKAEDKRTHDVRELRDYA